MVVSMRIDTQIRLYGRSELNDAIESIGWARSDLPFVINEGVLVFVALVLGMNLATGFFPLAVVREEGVGILSF